MIGGFILGKDQASFKMHKVKNVMSVNSLEEPSTILQGWRGGSETYAMLVMRLLINLWKVLDS